jgi:hypothetical protein
MQEPGQLFSNQRSFTIYYSTVFIHPFVTIPNLICEDLLILSREDGAKYRVKSRIPVVLAKLQDLTDAPGRKYAFEIGYSKERYTVGLPSQQEKDTWIKDFLQVKTQAQSFISSKDYIVLEAARQRDEHREREAQLKLTRDREEKERLAKEKRDKAQREKEQKVRLFGL